MDKEERNKAMDGFLHPTPKDPLAELEEWLKRDTNIDSLFAEIRRLKGKK